MLFRNLNANRMLVVWPNVALGARMVGWCPGHCIHVRVFAPATRKTGVAAIPSQVEYASDCGSLKKEETLRAQVQRSTLRFLLQVQGTTVDLNGSDSLEILRDIKHANPIA